MSKPAINHIIFDLDDTLIDTHGVFVPKIKSLCKLISNEVNVPSEVVRRKLNGYQADAFRKQGINPHKLWPAVLQRLGEDFPKLNSLTLQQIEDGLWSIYKEVPTLHSSAIDLLDHVANLNISAHVLTHALEDWTNYKIDSLQLRDRFGHVFFASVDEHKGAKHWKAALKSLDVPPEEVLAVGDNVKGDIIAASEAGIKNLAWVNRSHGWKVYREGKLPENAHTISDLKEIIDLL